MQRDDAYLLDMLLAAQRAAQHVSGIEPDQFATSLLHQDAVIRELEIVGEAARRVSDPMKADHPAIDWAGIIGMRHRLVTTTATFASTSSGMSPLKRFLC
jgi:uncharacterized protein with HEPN domain